MPSRTETETPELADRHVSRRQLLKGSAVAPAVAFTWTTPGSASASTPAVAPLPAAVSGEALPLRMQRELQRALAKSVDQRRWVIAIDTRRCVGCSGCTVSCAVENKLPPDLFYRRVTEQTTGTYPDVRRRFFSQACMQCDAPPCIPVCPVEPTKATYVRPDGIVAVDYDRCIGCGACVAACPYDARFIDSGQLFTDGTPRHQAYEGVTAWEYGQARKRDGKADPAGKARKCHFCVHRLEAGMLPACVTTCIANAISFGDLNDPASLVAELNRRSGVKRLKEEAGTKPRVFYLT